MSPGNFPATPDHPENREEAATYLLSATLFHDTVQHLDEVEIDIDSVTVRVTPTSLKDSAKGLQRFLELVELTTKEMERKVHEEGRNARRIGQGKRTLLIMSVCLHCASVSLFVYFRSKERRYAFLVITRAPHLALRGRDGGDKYR